MIDGSKKTQKLKTACLMRMSKMLDHDILCPKKKNEAALKKPATSDARTKKAFRFQWVQSKIINQQSSIPKVFLNLFDGAIFPAHGADIILCRGILFPVLSRLLGINYQFHLGLPV